MNKDQLKKAINFLDELRHIKKKYDLDCKHLASKHYGQPGCPGLSYNMNLTYMFGGLSTARKEEEIVIDKWYKNYNNRLFKADSTES